VTKEGIHRVRSEDFPRILEVWEASVRATHHFLTEDDIQSLKPLIPGVLDRMRAIACVRDDGGRVAGFVAVDGSKMEALFVHPSWMGLGIGRRLVTYSIDELGVTDVDVNEENKEAVAFYQKMGFEVVGRSDVDGQGMPHPLLHMRLA